MDNTSNPNKKQKTDADGTAEIAPMSALTTSNTGGVADTSGRTGETPVSIPPTITYGLQDTHTTILPAVMWLTAPDLNYGGLVMGLNMTSIYNCFSEGILSTHFDPTKFWNKKAGPGVYSLNDTNGYTYPITQGATQTGGIPNLIPWYRRYWENLYQFYTVLGCEYEITMHLPSTTGTRALVAHSIQTSGTQDATLLPKETNLGDMLAMKNVQYTQIANNNNTTNPFTTLKGVYKPGSAKRDVANDGDIKLWTEVSASPTYKEILQIHFYKHPFSVDSRTNEPNQVNINLEVKLKYIVQYKQLLQSAKYPIGTATATECNKFPNQAQPYMA